MHAVIRRMSGARPEIIKWLWKSRIPMGQLTLLVGDPKLGKGLVTLDIAARVSGGLPWPDSGERPMCGSVLILSAEDGSGDTLRPRLEVAKADGRRVYFFEAIHDYIAEEDRDVERPFSLTTDIAELKKQIKRRSDVRLVIINPLSAYMGSTDTHKNAQVRAVLHRLAKLAIDLRVAVVAVTHNNKNQEVRVMDRATGRIAFVPAAQAVWAVVKDKSNPERRLMLPIKNYFAPDKEGLAYTVVRTAKDVAPRIDWEPEPVRDFDIYEALARNHARPTLFDKVCAWLSKTLQGGPRPTKVLKKRAKMLRFSWKTVEEAKERLGIEAKRVGGIASADHWIWRLPKGLRSQSSDGKDAVPSDEPIERLRLRLSTSQEKEQRGDSGKKFAYVPRTREQMTRRLREHEAYEQELRQESG